MTLDEFNNMDYDSKLLMVVDNGVFLDNYITENVRMNLYSVDKFYVELVYDGTENKISEIRSFNSGIHLDKYTENIDLRNY